MSFIYIRTLRGSFILNSLSPLNGNHVEWRYGVFSTDSRCVEFGSHQDFRLHFPAMGKLPTCCTADQVLMQSQDPWTSSRSSDFRIIGCVPHISVGFVPAGGGGKAGSWYLE